jgi:uncharacterized protein YdcH (DUF465 family)
MGIFDKKKATTKKKSTAKQKTQVTPTFETKEEIQEFNEKLDKFATLKAKITELTAEYKTIEGDIKEMGVEEFCKLLGKTGKKESFHITSEAGGTVMVVPQDKYLTIDEERAEYLNETYGTFDDDENLVDSIVDEKTEFKFNMKVLERNQSVIEKFFEECDEISDEDKENLIEGVTKYTVKKGTIDRLYLLSKEKEVDIETLYEEVRPVLQLKGAKASS